MNTYLALTVVLICLGRTPGAGLAEEGSRKKRTQSHPSFALVFFGVSETLHPLVDVGLKGPDGQSLTLGYKTRKAFIFLGVLFRDDGYILIDGNDDSKYFKIPHASERRRLVEAGMLPGKFPHYKIPVWEYLIGFSLWIIIAVGLLLKAAELFVRWANGSDGTINVPPRIVR